MIIKFCIKLFNGRKGGVVSLVSRIKPAGNYNTKSIPIFAISHTNPPIVSISD